MTSSFASGPAPSKSNLASNSPAGSSQSSSNAPTLNDNQRRGNTPTLSSGGNSANRNKMPVPRNNQSKKGNHRNTRKFSLEDALATQVETTGRRKGTNITHLLDWNSARPPIAPRVITSGYRQPSRRPAYPTWGLGSGHHFEDKARYINSNYRFIVDPAGDYRAQAVDSDVFVPWDKVLQVVASQTSQASSCPICLCDTVAPRMAKCGHIFCLPCLLRYMATSDDPKSNGPAKPQKWKKCPICWDSVYPKDTRPVRWFVGQENPPPKVGEEVILRLIMKQPGSTLALPTETENPLQKGKDIPMHFDSECLDYARIMKGSKSYMTEQFESEISSLRSMYEYDKLMYNEDGEWTRKAVGSIKQEIEALEGMEDILPPTAEEQEKQKPAKREPIKFNESNEGVPDMYLYEQASKSQQAIASEDQNASRQEPSGGVEKITEGLLTASLKPKGRHSAHPAHVPYFFYQALPHYYLAALDIRILKAAFGNFSSFPPTLIARVENILTGQVADYELRRRVRYLSHLPAGCEVTFLECDWSGIVSDEVLKQFEREINERRSKKRRKELREEQDRQRAERAEMAERWQQIRVERNETFGSSINGAMSDADFVPLPSASPPQDATPPSPNQMSRPSQTTVWGTRAVDSPLWPHDTTPRSNNRDDGWLDWEQQLMEEDLLAHEQYDDQIHVTAGRAPPQGKSQQKKKKKLTLMSNGGRRGA